MRIGAFVKNAEKKLRKEKNYDLKHLVISRLVRIFAQFFGGYFMQIKSNLLIQSWKSCKNAMSC